MPVRVRCEGGDDYNGRFKADGQNDVTPRTFW